MASDEHPERLDLLLKGGRVIDPANDVDAVRDVGIRDGKIACVAEAVPAERAEYVVDVSGLLVTPGLIDIHVHSYVNRLNHRKGDFSGSLDADAHFLREGVTTCVDAGTAGCEEFAHFRESVIEPSVIRMLAYVNISGPGMGAPEQDVRTLDPKAAAKAVSEHADVAVGIKTAHYWTRAPFDADHPAWASVERAVEAGELCGMPVMVDFWPRPPERPYPDLILKKLRPGDIHTHVFARQFPIVDENGKVYDYMFEARERGVWFDMGHGAGSFWFRNGARAFAGGFVPDSISTDLHTHNIRGPVVSLLETMSKCLIMGMPLQEVIYRATVTPALAIRRPELPTLSVGTEADVAVLEHLKGTFSYRDCGYARMDGEGRLACRLTLRGGKVAWDREAVMAPKWEDAPAGYWNLEDAGTPARRLWR